ncbi:MAG TPA: SUMF1/EgtB/PvdO family nonheme iron enzyme [Xanthomonadales bacterium]|nr:SUMF1/EgtB/PvdO family nonheme iron enzyme [Xanthomonadales bacterium]
MFNVSPARKNAIGGALGLVLLAFAFAYRWIGPERLGLRPSVELPPALVERAPVAPGAPAARPAPAATAATASDPATEVPTPRVDSLSEVSEEARAEVEDALARAEVARAAGHLIEPAEDSALYWYDAALEVDPDNESIEAARDAVVEFLVEQANLALDSGDPAPAQALLLQLESREGVAAQREGLTARVAALPRTQELLRQGAQRMAQGRRFDPYPESALESYRAALELDPRNLAARQGLEQIELAVLEQALAAASDDRFADADRLMSLASTIQTGTQVQLETRTRIVDLRSQRSAALLNRAEAALDARDVDSADALLTRAIALAADPGRVDAIRERIANARLYEHREPGEVFADPFLDRAGSGPELVVLPIGRFTMGSPESERGRKNNEGPAHEVEVARAFALGRHELTVSQFRRFVRASDYETDAERAGASTFYDESSGRLGTGRGVDWRKDYRGERAKDDDPVVHVSFNDATAYVAWLSERTGKRYRLPSEAEWEYAERAGSTARYAWGAGNPTRVIGNFTGDGDRSVSGRSWTKAFPRYNDGYWGPAPTGRFAANAFGLFDMSGNVSEWVEDCWHDSYLRAPADGSAWINPGCGRRVVRGGSWGSAPEQTRSAFRVSAADDTRSARVGIRVARDL